MTHPFSSSVVQLTLLSDLTKSFRSIRPPWEESVLTQRSAYRWFSSSVLTRLSTTTCIASIVRLMMGSKSHKLVTCRNAFTSYPGVPGYSFLLCYWWCFVWFVIIPPINFEGAFLSKISKSIMEIPVIIMTSFRNICAGHIATPASSISSSCIKPISAWDLESAVTSSRRRRWGSCLVEKNLQL